MPSGAEKRREELKIKIATLFDLFGGTYGYRRIHAELVRAGEHVGEELVRELMRELNLPAVQPKPYKRTTIAGEHAVPDLVARDFTAQRPGVKLVGDITYIKTWQGWLYLATVIDCFNKEVIGYAMAEHMRTELVTDALDMAARNHQLEQDCIMSFIGASHDSWNVNTPQHPPGTLRRAEAPPLHRIRSPGHPRQQIRQPLWYGWNLGQLAQQWVGVVDNGQDG